MMRRGAIRAALSLLALCATWTLALGGTLSAFNATSTTATNAFSAAPDWTAPIAATAAIGRAGAYETGFTKQGANYYVYANVSDAGNPASAIASITANVNSITSAHPAVALIPGTYTAGGVTYNYRSAVLTAMSNLATGTYSYAVTSTDNASNTGTKSFTTAIDNTPPSAIDVQSTNATGKTIGHLDQGDTLTLTYSGAIDPYSVLSGWNGSATGIQAALVDGGGSSSDSIYIYTTAASPTQVPLGVIYLGASGYVNKGTGQYIVYGQTGSGTPSTMTRSGPSIVVTLGTPNGSSSTITTRAAMTWVPSTTATDIAGNAVSGSTATQTGTVHVNF